MLGLDAERSVRECVTALDPRAPADYRELAACLAHDWSRRPPRRVGLAGGQGAGKSTLGRSLEAACEFFGIRTRVLALDDFYLTKAERVRLAQSIHPLFETRGPPGTHDTRLCRSVLDALLEPGIVRRPVFDKGLDDRTGEALEAGPFDLVVLEGWCIGARPAAPDSLAHPINALEADQDVEGVWRNYVNDRLGDDYASLFADFDQLVYLRVPSLDAVRRWRLHQESDLPEERRLDAADVDHFVAHYERVTRAMLEDLPERADWTVSLAEDHTLFSIERNRDAR